MQASANGTNGAEKSVHVFRTIDGGGRRNIGRTKNGTALFVINDKEMWPNSDTDWH